MIRETFDKELIKLQNDVLALANMVEGMLIDTVLYLKARDFAGSERVIEMDKRVNEKRFQIEDEVLTIIALRQPYAGDLRALAAMLEFASELERIGDYAKGIAKINLLIGNQELVKPLIDIPLMCEKATFMLREVMKAYVRRDVELARAIPPMDDELDALYNQIYRELVTYILTTPSCLNQANYLLWAAHNLERTGDRVINLCERVVFTVTGELEELN
ncbi:MAG: phosphate signaling complex protein PhoU [Anaerolineaceae bacterium]|nr:phosphate signaling complex protein PhoU [Anaerolineaceae bacterium]